MGSSKEDGDYLDIAAYESSDNGWYSIEGYINFFQDITFERELMTGSWTIELNIVNPKHILVSKKRSDLV